MDVRVRTLAISEALRAEGAALLSGEPVPAAALRELRLAELRGSLAAAGIAFAPAEIARLTENGLAPGGRSLEQCDAVADYAAACERIRTSGRLRPHRKLLRLDEIARLHALATRRSSSERPGEWRAATAPALPGGVVPPPAWLVPRSMSAFVERFESGPGTDRPLVLWLADCYERFARIRPFATANGRVGRLILNLALARLGFPPLVLRSGDATTLADVLERAGAGELWPCSHFFGRNLLHSVRTLEFARRKSSEELLPLGRIAAAHERAALYKAAQRGRLRTVRRGTSIYTSKTWLDEYRSSRAAAGRPPAASFTDATRTSSAFSPRACRN